MRPNSMREWKWRGSILALLAVALSAGPTPAVAQLQGDLPSAWGYTLLPDPPLATGLTAFHLYGNYPTRCGDLQDLVVTDSAHVSLRVHSTACVDTMSDRWVATFTLGQLAAGIHTVQIQLTMDRPDSGVSVHTGWLTFEVVGGGPSVPPPPPGPPPPPPPGTPLLESITTDPYEPTPARPMALILGGHAPFGCPVVTSATVVDTSHLALTLAPSTPCADDSGSRAWSHRFELGLQREGHHAMSLAIVLAGDVLDTVYTSLDFLVFNDSVVSPPPDSLEHVLSPSRPNPFAGQTHFSVSIDSEEDADVSVFDLLGRRVRRVFHGRLPAGTTELAWNGERDDGTRAVAGVYFYRLEMRGRVVSRRLILLRQL